MDIKYYKLYPIYKEKYTTTVNKLNKKDLYNCLWRPPFLNKLQLLITMYVLQYLYTIL